MAESQLLHMLVQPVKRMTTSRQERKGGVPAGSHQASPGLQPARRASPNRPPAASGGEKGACKIPPEAQQSQCFYPTGSVLNDPGLQLTSSPALWCPGGCVFSVFAGFPCFSVPVPLPAYLHTLCGSQHMMNKDPSILHLSPPTSQYPSPAVPGLHCLLYSLLQ